MDEDTQGTGGTNWLTNKLGPLPAWQWLALAAGLALIYYLLIGRNQTAPATAAEPAGTSVASEDIPQFVINNQLMTPPSPAPMSNTVNIVEPPQEHITPAPSQPSAPSKVPVSVPVKIPVKTPAGAPKPAGHGVVPVVKYTSKHPPWASTISGIATHYGIRDWKTVWNDPHNAQLRAQRKKPELIQPGDKVYVP
jgi:hypothetical protein